MTPAKAAAAQETPMPDHPAPPPPDAAATPSPASFDTWLERYAWCQGKSAGIAEATAALSARAEAAEARVAAAAATVADLIDRVVAEGARAEAAEARAAALREGLEFAKKVLEGAFDFAARKGVWGVHDGKRETIGIIDAYLAAAPAAPRR